MCSASPLASPPIVLTFDRAYLRLSGKQEDMSQPMLPCTSTNRMTGMEGDWKLSSMGCLCSEAPARRRAADEDGVALAAARRAKGWALVPERGLSSCVKVGGRWVDAGSGALFPLL